MTQHIHTAATKLICLGLPTPEEVLTEARELEVELLHCKWAVEDQEHDTQSPAYESAVADYHATSSLTDLAWSVYACLDNIATVATQKADLGDSRDLTT
jgi:hypothetical protein